MRREVLMATLTKERQGRSLARRCWAASELSAPARRVEGTGSAEGWAPASDLPPSNSST